ncbi:MAG: ABC transporter permease, partial [Candidatus Methanofastidiosa archaeon]|nr:ABC transporter permease [Candidatus Methanofastidiosa archaeon]
MYNLIKADLFKLRKSMAIKILLGITTVSSIAMIMMAYLLQQGKLSASASGLGFMFSDANMISILGAGVASIII